MPGLEDSVVSSVLIEFVRTAWFDLSADMRPALVYIRAVAPREGSPDDIVCVQGDVVKVWRFNAQEVVPVPLWDYERFASLHFNPLWNSTQVAPSAIWGPGTHEIALSTLCEFPHAQEYYLDYQWGGRYGRGLALTLDGTTISRVRDLWRS